MTAPSRAPLSDPPQPKSGRAFGALHHRDFRYFWIGGVISQVGSWMQQVAQGWLVYDLSGSAFLVGLNGLFQAVPFILVSLYAGTVVDRIDRKRLLFMVETFNTTVVLVIGVLIATGQIQLWHIYVSSVMYSLAGGFESPTRQALLPHLVPRSDLMTGISLMSVQRKGAQIIGPALGGVFVAAFGIAGSYFINAGGRFILLWCLLQMRTKTPLSDRPRVPALVAIAEGFRYVRGVPLIGMLLLLECVISLFGGYLAMMVVFARDVYGSGPEGLGILQSAAGAGSVAGSFALATLGDIQKKGRLLLFSGVVYGAALTTFAFCPSFVVALPLLALVGAFDIVYGATRNTIMQLSTPPEMLGRVMSLSAISLRGLGQFGTFQTGSLASVVGIQWALALGAMLCIACTLTAAWRVPVLRQFSGTGSPVPHRGRGDPA